MAAALVGGGYGGVYDLDEGGRHAVKIAGWKLARLLSGYLWSTPTKKSC
jgi:hypothetical protein